MDPFPSITGPLPAVDPPDPQVVRDLEIRAALPSVVCVLGTACGLGISGLGWVAGPNIVVTDAHVIAGQTDTTADGRRRSRSPSIAGTTSRCFASGV